MQIPLGINIGRCIYDVKRWRVFLLLCNTKIRDNAIVSG